MFCLIGDHAFIEEMRTYYSPFFLYGTFYRMEYMSLICNEVYTAFLDRVYSLAMTYIPTFCDGVYTTF
jgi:hypothetical protein